MRVSTMLAALPLALANPIAEKRTEPAPLYLHESESDVVARSGNDKFIPEKRTEPAPLYLHESESDLVARGGSDKFIIKFKGENPFSVVEDAMHSVKNESVMYRYENNFRGFTAHLDRAAVEDFRMVPGVEYIEQDMVGTLSGFRTQNRAPWGLGRISHRRAGASEYVYDEAAGEGVCIYVTDSGVDERHPEFEGRARQIRSFIRGSNVDDNGHGTHCAGTIASASFGVAKKAAILGVKVLNSEGRFRYSDLIAAYDFIQRDARQRNCPGGFAVSGSLGGSFSRSLNDAADAMVDAGFFMAVAAGNDNEDARGFSPASARKVCTVGGTAWDDTRYSQSNFGPVVDIHAPGVDVLSTVPGGRTAVFTGTSMATPHVAGLAAYLASKDGVRVSPSMCRRIVEMSTKNAIRNQKPNTVNNVAYNGNGL